jgi:hypothetical protein
MCGAQIAGRTGNHEQIGHQARAMRTIFQMSPLRSCAAAIVFDQALLQLNTRHTALPKPLFLHCRHFKVLQPDFQPSFAASLRWLAS